MTRLITILLITFPLNAQFPVDGPYRSIHTSPPPLPSLYSSIIDSSVPTPIQITRITEYVMRWDWYPHHEYSKIQPWNADATIYKFYSVAIYDSHTFRMIRELPGSELYPTYWSNTNPDIIYSFRENGDVKTYIVSQDRIILHDHITDTNHNSYEVVKLGPGEGNIDKYDHYVALVGKRGNDLDVIIYNLQTFHTELIRTFNGAWGNGSNDFPQYIDWVSVSQSGDYVGIMWDHNNTSPSNPFNGHFGVEIYRRIDMQFLRRIADYGNHGDFGYDTQGREVFVQFWGPTGSLNMYYLDHLERVVLSNNPDFEGEGHISCRNLQRPGWAYVSEDDSSRSGQIIAVKLDRSGTFEHFGHHFSSSLNYLKSPMPVPSPDGTMVMFKSDFWDTTHYVVYTFISTAESPQGINEGDIPSPVKVFPTLAKDFLYISGSSHVIKVEILNVTGQQIMTYSSCKICKIDLRNLTQGVYIAKIFTEKGILKEKFIKVAR